MHIAAKLARFGAFWILPVWAFGAGGSCWLRDGAAPAPSTAYLLCEQGTLWTTVDSGKTWTPRDMKAAEKVRAVSFLDAQHGLAVGDRGLLIATDDGGRTWQKRDSGTTNHLMDISFVGSSGWIAAFQGVVLHTSDGGKTWAAQKTGTTQTLESIYFADEKHGWAVGWAGTILRTLDGGEKWEQVKVTAATWSLTSVFFKDDKNGWIVGFAGQILRSKDGGATWQPQTSSVRGWLTSIAFDAKGRGWITHDDGFLTSEDNGETWKNVPAEGRYFLARLIRVNDALWAIGQSTVLRQVDNGKWQKIQELQLGATAAAASAEAAGETTSK
ncbi:MAG TPA: YCF48-related protein [Bryobacteraceae bacterium]|jgi:photosystem II stability/assembly factor-like uncharacterized protein